MLKNLIIEKKLKLRMGVKVIGFGFFFFFEKFILIYIECNSLLVK